MTNWKHWRRTTGIALAAMLATAGGLQAQTLKVAMHSDLKIIDPIWTTALIATDHGFLVYDTLFSTDEKLAVKPQMVDKWTVSGDKLTWTFTLREGLEWHDGAPVTAEDCIASLKRWGARDTVGRRLVSLITEWTNVDARTFSFKLQQPSGLVLQSLAKPSASVAFMMPKRVAETDPAKQISNTTGSGPFIFKRDEWRPGEKAVYVKNPRYKPRSEPADGLAGGKIAKVDRVEWINIPDAQTQINALSTGEIDMVQLAVHDLLPLLQSDPNVAIVNLGPAGRQIDFRFNTLHKPFDNPKIRQAVGYAFSQKDFLEAQIGDPAFYRECKSLFPCGTAFESTKGWEGMLNGDTAKAAALLKEAGYDGTPIVLLRNVDTSSNLPPVAKQQLEKAGFKVDMQSMDWQTLVSRLTKKDAPAQGGWNAYITSWGAIDVLDPVTTAFLDASCEKARPGWPCDPELEQLRKAFAFETDPAKQKAIAEQVTAHVATNPTHIPLGQYLQPSAFRKNISGILRGGQTAFWNIEKK